MTLVYIISRPLSIYLRLVQFFLALMFRSSTRARRVAGLIPGHSAAEVKLVASGVRVCLSPFGIEPVVLLGTGLIGFV